MHACVHTYIAYIHYLHPLPAYTMYVHYSDTLPTCTNINACTPACLPAYLPAWISTYLPINLPIHLTTFLPTCLLIHLHAYSPTYLPTHLPACLPTYLHNYIRNGLQVAENMSLKQWTKKHGVVSLRPLPPIFKRCGRKKNSLTVILRGRPPGISESAGATGQLSTPSGSGGGAFDRYSIWRLS